MEWKLEPKAGNYSLTVPQSVETWAELQPYFAATWAKLLSDLLALCPAATLPPLLWLLIDGREGWGSVSVTQMGAAICPRRPTLP